MHFILMMLDQTRKLRISEIRKKKTQTAVDKLIDQTVKTGTKTEQNKIKRLLKILLKLDPNQRTELADLDWLDTFCNTHL